MRMRIRAPGIFLTLDPGSGMKKNSDPRYTSRIRNTGFNNTNSEENGD